MKCRGEGGERGERGGDKDKGEEREREGEEEWEREEDNDDIMVCTKHKLHGRVYKPSVTGDLDWVKGWESLGGDCKKDSGK